MIILSKAKWFLLRLTEFDGLCEKIGWNSVLYWVWKHSRHYSGSRRRFEIVITAVGLLNLKLLPQLYLGVLHICGSQCTFLGWLLCCCCGLSHIQPTPAGLAWVAPTCTHQLFLVQLEADSSNMWFLWWRFSPSSSQSYDEDNLNGSLVSFLITNPCHKGQEKWKTWSLHFSTLP